MKTAWNVRRSAALVVSLLVCFAAAGLGGLATSTSVGDWYPGLNKPPFNPPAWLFAPVWNLLFALMAVAAWRIYDRVPAGVIRRAALTLFGLQLLANVLWSVLFFGLRQPGGALIEILLLEALIVATTIVFWRLDRIAGALLVPYTLWVAFAIALNGAIWWLN
jgi:tryptophan-rich sensory protein